jgi:2-polyprenyl-6-methoxyphenol hydroxylase-like FAD-dependent oxidoreductase
MLECMKQDNVQLNTKVVSVKENESDMVVLEAIKNGKDHLRVETKYVLACDSAHSVVRDSLKIKM